MNASIIAASGDDREDGRYCSPRQKAKPTRGAGNEIVIFLDELECIPYLPTRRYGKCRLVNVI